MADEEIESTEETEETIDDSSTLDKAVKGAEQVVDETFGKNVKKDSTEDEEETKDDDKEDEDDDEEEKEAELTPEQQIHAKNIFRMLSNPETAKDTLKALSIQAGLEFKEPETKKELNTQKKAVRDVIKEALGTNYPHLADVLGVTLENLLTEVVAEQTKELRGKFDKLDHANLVNSIKSAQESVVNEYVDVPARVLREVVRMQDEEEIVPGTNSKPDVFFRTAIRMAAENIGVTLVKKTITPESKPRKERSPLDELSSKSRGSSGGGTKEGIKTTQVKSFSDAIKLGVEQVTASMKK